MSELFGEGSPIRRAWWFMTERLESGMVAVNRGLLSGPGARFGGVTQNGREGGQRSLLEFLEEKYAAVDWT